MPLIYDLTACKELKEALQMIARNEEKLLAPLSLFLEYCNKLRYNPLWQGQQFL